MSSGIQSKSYSGWTVVELREKLRELGLPVSGNKDALIERLVSKQALKEKKSEKKKEVASQENGKSFKCDPAIQKRPYVPQPHQLRAVQEFLRSGKRGMGLFHELGSGKTCTYIGCVDAFLEESKKPMIVNVFAPASLIGTHREQYCNFCGHDSYRFENNFRFFSYNDRRGIVKRLPASLDNSIIVVDEVQEVINGKSNKSATLSAVYDKIYHARGCRVILLSGTPIFSEYQLSLYLNLLAPASVPMDKEDFLTSIKISDDKFKEDFIYPRIKGLISYVPIANPDLYPRRIFPDIEVSYPMSEYQFSKYSELRIQELSQVRKDLQKLERLRQTNPRLYNKLKGSMFIQSTKLLSRQVCNFAYPEEVEVMMKAKQYTSDFHADWVLNDQSDTHVANLKKYSPKMAGLVYNILTKPGKHMVYMWNKTKYGIYLVASFLRHCGIRSITFSGDLGTDEKRQLVINKFNNIENKSGDQYKVILVSGAGAMGISLFGIRHVHIFEASLNEFITVQAIGRAFRTRSHHQLPPEERTVQVYRYFTSLPKGVEFEEDKTTEEQMYERGMQKRKAVENLIEIVKRGAFDCKEPYNKAIRGCHEYGRDEEEKKNGTEEDADVKYGEQVEEQEIIEDFE